MITNEFRALWGYGKGVPSATALREACYAKIEKKVSFHIARHTFATTVTLQNGIPIETVSKMLGHTNIKTTQHYAKVLDTKISKDMEILKSHYLRIA